MEAQLPAYITKHQWHCLSDAAEGKRIAPTTKAWDVFQPTPDGAVQHHKRVIHALLAGGLLQASSDDRYVGTALTRPAMRLPVRGA